ncbi:hypothetical protein JHW43_008594 [Diplocarpon mali]|nr:hypothetical protein JHW43_008594 [Diplocarpon mali]
MPAASIRLLCHGRFTWRMPVADSGRLAASLCMPTLGHRTRAYMASEGVWPWDYGIYGLGWHTWHRKAYMAYDGLGIMAYMAYGLGIMAYMAYDGLGIMAYMAYGLGIMA